MLEGAASALKGRRLRHIIFEDHLGANSEVMTRLLDYGYAIYSVGWTLSGPKLGDAAHGAGARTLRSAKLSRDVDT